MKHQALVFGMLAACTGKVELYSCSVSSGGGIDRAKLVQTVERLARDTATPARDVRCPTPRWVVGQTFECEVDLASGTFAAVVEMEAEDRAQVSWKQPMIGGDRLERELAKLWIGDVDGVVVEQVDCGDQLLVSGAEGRVLCAVDGSQPGKIEAWLDADRALNAQFAAAATWNPTTQAME